MLLHQTVQAKGNNPTTWFVNRLIMKPLGESVRVDQGSDAGKGAVSFESMRLAGGSGRLGGRNVVRPIRKSLISASSTSMISFILARRCGKQSGA